MNRNQKTLLRNVVFTFATVVIFAVGWLYINADYGEVSYPAYQAATALYGACLAKSETRVAKIQTLIEPAGALEVEERNKNSNDSLGLTKITDQERAWLQSIITKAEDGRWDAAAAAAKQMMVDQIDRG